MGLANNLIRKLKRRQEFVQKNNLPRLKDRINQRDEIIARNPGIFNVFRSIARQLNRSFGNSSLPSPTKRAEEKLIKVDNLDRHDFGGSNFGIRLRRTIDAVGAKEVTKITCIADDTESLNNTYFLIRGLAENFYVWINVDGDGEDPGLAGMTGVEVDISENDSNSTVATAVASALDGLADFIASAALAVVTCTTQELEAEADASEGAVPTGFTFEVTTQGVTPMNDALLRALGIQPGDIVEVLSGANKGKQYEVMALIDPNTIKLEDDSAFGIAETDIYLKLKIAGNKRSYN